MDRQHREAEWGRIHSSNGTMRRSNVPPRLTLSSPKSERSYNLDPSSIMSPQRSLFPQTAPLEGRGPDLRLHPATVTTPNFPEGSMTSLSRVSTKSSYESFSFRDRSGSSETAKGVAAKPAEETTIDTLSGQRSAVGDERVPLRRDYSPFTQAGRTYGSLAGRRVPSSSASVMLSSTRRRMHSSIMHGVVLAIQGSMTLAVFSALIWVTIWQKDDSDLEFWDWLWTIAEPALAAETLLCFAALLTHELRGGLSAVALLYVQSGILVLTTCTALALTVRSVGQESRAVKGALMGCDVMMWGMAFVGFVRAVVVWKAEGEREEREVHGDAGHGAGPWKQ